MITSFNRALSILALVALAACAAETTLEPPPDLLSREDFVEAYVALRLSALERGSQTPLPPARDAVLAEYQVTGEDLFQFIEYHGRDIEFMRVLWDDIEEIVDGLRQAASAPRAPETG